MARAVATDLGLRGATRDGPAWRRDNPFLQKLLRTEPRQSGFYWRLFLTAAVLAGILLVGLALDEAYRREFRFATALFGVPVPTLFFFVVSLAHVGFVASARSAMATSLQTEVRRQTLDGLLMTPLRRPEMLVAMAVGPAAGALLVGLAGLPLYVYLHEIGGAEWRDVVLLYLLFAVLAFSPPGYGLPALSGAAATPETQSAAARSARRGGSGLSGAAGFFSAFWYIFFLAFVGRWASAMGGGWAAHLLDTLPPAVTGLGPLFVIAWPFCFTQVLATPLAFFGTSLGPWVYLLPLLAATWVSGVLRSGAALAAGDYVEMRRLPIYRRYLTLARWTGRVALFCLIGFTWQAWVVGGDTGRVLHDLSGGLGGSLAGLLLILGSVGALLAAAQAGGFSPLRQGTERLRAARLVLRRAAKRAWRPLRVTLALFALACLCGHASPFVRPVYIALGQLAGVTLALIAFALGYGVWAARLRERAKAAQSPRLRWAATIARDLAYVAFPLAIALPSPVLWNLAAFSPLVTWLRLFPGAPSLIREFPYWPLGALPPLWLCVVASTLFGVLFFALGYALAPSASPLPSEGEGPGMREAPKSKAERFVPQTAALLSWVTARTDNPLFTHEVRVRTRSGKWVHWFMTAPLALALALAVAATYPDFIHTFSFLALLNFFPQQSLGVATPVQADADLAGLLLSWQAYRLGFSGQILGENLITADQQRGTLGFLLITPLRSAQIFWGKVCGQLAPYAAGWAVTGLCALVLYLLAAGQVGFGPALGAWLVGQVFVAAVFLLGVGMGAALATHTLVLRALRGVSTLLMLAALGGGAWLVFQILPSESPWGWGFLGHAHSWTLLADRLLAGTVIALVLAAPAYAYGQWRLDHLRRRDIPFGDSVPE